MGVQVHAQDVNHDHIVLNTIPELFYSKTFCDVSFICKGCNVVEAHRLLLGAISPLLQGLFIEQAWRDVIQISLPECEVTDVCNVLRLAYEGVVRLDNSEMKEFEKIKLMLGLNMKTEVIDSLSGSVLDIAEPTNYNTLSRNEDEDSRSIATGEDSSNLVAYMNPPKENKRLNAKRKCEEEHPVSKKPNTEKDEVIENLNNIISHLAPPFQNQRTEETQDSNGEQSKPLLVPVKYLPALLGFIEKRKTEKRLEELIEAYVKKHLLRLKSERRKKKNDKQIMNGFASPVKQADPKNFKQGLSVTTQSHHSL